MSIKTMRTTLTIDDDWFAKAVNYLHCRSISFHQRRQMHGRLM